MGRLLSTKDVARKLDVTASRVRQIILAGKLPATKLGRDWFVKEEDVEAYQTRREQQGGQRLPPKGGVSRRGCL